MWAGAVNKRCYVTRDINIVVEHFPISIRGFSTFVHNVWATSTTHIHNAYFAFIIKLVNSFLFAQNIEKHHEGPLPIQLLILVMLIKYNNKSRLYSNLYFIETKNIIGVI